MGLATEDEFDSRARCWRSHASNAVRTLSSKSVAAGTTWPASGRNFVSARNQMNCNNRAVPATASQRRVAPDRHSEVCNAVGGQARKDTLGKAQTRPVVDVPRWTKAHARSEKGRLRPEINEEP